MLSALSRILQFGCETEPTPGEPVQGDVPGCDDLGILRWDRLDQHQVAGPGGGIKKQQEFPKSLEPVTTKTTKHDRVAGGLDRSDAAFPEVIVGETARTRSV